MRRPIPPEIDDLMWTLAESGNAKAIEEFGERYSEYRSQMSRRIETVRGLKKTPKPEVETPKVKSFTPRDHVAPDTTLWARVFVGGVALLAIAALAFVATMLLTKEPKAEPLTPSTNSAPPQDASSAAVPESRAVQPQRPNASTSPVPDPIKDAATTKRVNVKLTDAPLSAVFELIQAQSGLRVVADAKVPNPNVTLEEYDVAPMVLLKRLGQTYGFVAFDEHDGTIIVAPGEDRGTPKPSSDGVNRQRNGG